MFIGDYLWSYSLVILIAMTTIGFSYWRYKYSLITKINILVAWAIVLFASAALYIGKLQFTGATGTNSIFAILVALAFLVMFFIPMVLYADRFILKPILRIDNMLSRISKGDLMQRSLLATNDELGKISSRINEVVEGLVSIIVGIKKSSVASAQLTENLSSSSEEVSAATQEINRSMQSISQEIKELSQIIMIDSVSLSNLKESLNEVMHVMANSKRTIEHTKEMTINASKFAVDANEKIRAILDSSDSTVSSIKSLEKKSSEIPDIVNSINEISEQTNLLALNAAIEAARAGEAGKGFAVVASEIRELADQSKKATQQIEKIINDILIQTSSAVQSVEKTGEEVKVGSKTISDALQSLQMIHSQVNNILENFNRLEEEMNKQKSENENVDSHREDINSFISSITLSLEKISSSTVDTASAMESISQQSQELAVNSDQELKMIDRFKFE